MKKFFRIASIFLILASFIGCPSPEIGKNPGEELKTGSIVGKVVYENENVKDYSGIQVSLISTNGLMAVDYCESRGISTNARKVEDIIFTDSKGNYNFKDVPEGVYTICASSDNSTKKAVLTNVTVTAGRTVTASDLGLTATGSITGKITIDGSTDGVLGLDVFIAGTSFVAKVGSDGNYEISNIPAKKGYILCVQKEKYTTTIEDNLEVKGNDTVKIDDEDLSSKDWEEDTVEQENPTFKWLGSFDTNPKSPKLYDAYFNKKNGCSYIWNGSSWDLLAQAGSNGINGLSITWKGSLERAPENPGIYWAYYNTKDGCSYIWNGSKWEIISQDGIDGEDGVDGVDGINGVNGLSIIWKGVSSVAPENPELNWVYFNSEDGCSYIWNGSSWDLLAQAGKDGVNGEGSSFKGIYNTIENVIPENVTLARNPYAENYQVDISLPYSEILPETGDKVTLKWEFTSDIDIKNLRVSLADCSELVNTWKDLTVDYITETVTKDEVISLEKTLELSSKPIENMTLIIRYNVEDTDVEANFITSSSSITLQRGDKEDSDNNIDTLSSQITCTAVEEGIKFDVYFLKEIISSENSKIIIKNIDDNINLIKTVTSLPNDNYSPITLIYPLVEKEKTYNFEVWVQNGNVNIGFKKFVITAIGGMGEYKVENADELEVTLSEDKVLSVTPQVFTDNSNVPILDYGFKYALYSNNDEAVSIWDGIWLYELNAAWNSSIGLDFDLKKIFQISGWRDYSYLESALKGRRFGVRTHTAIKIAGYTYNDTVHFELNDYKETFFDWDEEEVSKVFVMYGYPYEDGTFYYFDDIPGVEKYYVLGNDEGMSFVEKGTKDAIEVYGKFVENGQTIQVPVCIPNIPKGVLDTTLYSFTGEWHINDIYSSTILPYDVVNIITSAYYDTIDEFKCIILIPEFEQVKAIAKFYDEDGKTLIDTITCAKNTYNGFVLTLPTPPEKENLVGYWVDEYGNLYSPNTQIMLDNAITNLTAIYDAVCYPPVEPPIDYDGYQHFTQPDAEFDGLSPNSSWSYLTYDLSEFAGRDVRIDFSADVRVVNNTAEDYNIWFQVNNGSEYPGINGEGDLFAPGIYEKTVTGSVNLTVNNGAMIYLSTHNNTADVQISLSNVNYTVYYGEEPAAKEYPTDIFTVGAAGTCGIQIGDGELKPFEVYLSGSVATDIKVNADGSVEWIASAAGGAGGGVALYLNGEDGTIDLSNYESIDVEFVYSPITGSWNPAARNPGFAVKILPWDATGIFGGAEDLIYFETNKEGYGTYKGTFEITDDFVNKIRNSSDFDAVKAFSLKFNDYERGNSDGDRVKVQLKTVKFNKKAGAPADKVFDDGLDEADYGTVQSIYYPTQDYTVAENAPKYEKHAWVYLPAGYDANDKDTKYPVFILLHGFGQNENTWGLSDQGNGGKIKGYMDRRMKSGEAEKFILVCVTGVASQNWGPNGSGQDFNGFNAFGGELRNDLLPYIRANYNVAEGRDNVALAGLSLGGGQTMNIGIGQSLDLISYFGAFSAAIFNSAEEYIPSVEETFPDLDINYLYMICGDADSLVIDGVRGVVNYIETNGWDKLGEKGKERFTYVEVPGGTHDFPVWYQGFKEYITYIFK